MSTMPSFKKRFIVEQFQGNYLNDRTINGYKIFLLMIIARQRQVVKQEPVKKNKKKKNKKSFHC